MTTGTIKAIIGNFVGWGRRAGVAAAALGLAAAVTMTAAPAWALPFSFGYSDTVTFSNVSGVAAGDAALIVVELDNGGTSILSQTWTAADAVSVTFNFNDGGLVTTFSAPFDGGLAAAVGSFVTGSHGTPTAVMTGWSDFAVTADVVSTSAATSYAWNLNGNNNVYNEFLTASTGIALTDVAAMLDPASWVRVPAPAALPLFAAGLVGLLFTLAALRRQG